MPPRTRHRPDHRAAEEELDLAPGGEARRPYLASSTPTARDTARSRTRHARGGPCERMRGEGMTDPRRARLRTGWNSSCPLARLAGDRALPPFSGRATRQRRLSGEVPRTQTSSCDTELARHERLRRRENGADRRNPPCVGHRPTFPVRSGAYTPRRSFAGQAYRRAVR